MRLFFAVEVPGHIRRSVVSAVAASGLAKPPWRWIPPENFHLTLKFLGDTDRSTLSAIEDAACEVAAATSGFELVFGDFGGFPDLKRPRVLFYGITEGFRHLAALAGRIDEATAKLGFPPETRPFKAHLTLARIKSELSPGLIARLEGFPPLPGGSRTLVDSFSLVRSHLSGSGASYERLAEFSLRK
ncbi:MAG TPA: RNA 2',3'-cyclic phosphodiesterase [Candidatus Krumholzibacterium sp.]|nr:RNA 2',3'-cyclic phosphodiesterase [Candidatus Krumholzibacterium sp.]